jgi:molybdopterin converting factor subunit 1
MRILFFAHLKDVTGQAEIEWKLNGSLDARAFWQKLLQTYPDLGRFQSTVRLARNCEFARPDTIFTDADEVALIPPVSGG